MKLLIVLTIVLCSIQYGLTFKCYTCSSHTTQECGDNFLKNIEEGDSRITTTECNTKCVTSKWEGKSVYGYYRNCTDIDFCQQLKDQRRGFGICKECNTDLCNTDIIEKVYPDHQ